VLREGNWRCFKHLKFPIRSVGHVGHHEKGVGRTIQCRNEDTRLQDGNYYNTVGSIKLDTDHEHGVISGARGLYQGLRPGATRTICTHLPAGHALAHGTIATAPTRVHKTNSVSNSMVFMMGYHIPGASLHPAEKKGGGGWSLVDVEV